MINSWSLAYDVFNGTLDKEYPIMKKDVTVLGGYEHSPFYYEYDRNTSDSDDNYNEPYINDSNKSNAVYHKANKKKKNVIDKCELEVDTNIYWYLL